MGAGTLQGNKITGVPARRVRRKRSLWRTRVWPTLRMIVLLATVATAAHLIGAKLVRPLRLLADERRETQRLIREMESLRKDNLVLQRKLRYLNTDRGRELELRRHGFVKPGEIMLVFPESKR